MRTLARVAVSSLIILGLGLAIVVVCVAAIGIVGTRSATELGNEIAGDELTTSTTTSQLARTMDSAYAIGETAFLVPGRAERSRMLGVLYSKRLPAAEAQLYSLERLHAGDPPAERAGIELLAQQWLAVRDLLSPTSVAAHPSGTLAARLTTTYQPVSAHLDRLLRIEQHDGHMDRMKAGQNQAWTLAFIMVPAVLGLAVGVLLLLSGIRRVRRNLEPGQDQAEFADTLQVANDEDEAHQLLQRHLERSISATTAVVLNRNNSADRLEAVTPLPGGSPLADSLRGAKPRSCLTIRSGRTHGQDGARSALLACPVCASCPGTTFCVPLIVGGQVIGSVLLNRAAPYGEAEQQRIRDSVGQAAPVLANLRNLAVAEIRAATDGLTGLPNKRAVADAMKRLFAQASTTASPVGLLLIDLDHFKQINDQWGHPVGDQILASVGAVLRSALRARDFAGRNGGEEFAVLLPETGIPAALDIAERIRAAIAGISLSGTDVSVTASLGVVGFPDHATSMDRLERLADAALYIAKREGRNRVQLADPATADPATRRPPAAEPPVADLPAAEPPAAEPPAAEPPVTLDTRA